MPFSEAFLPAAPRSVAAHRWSNKGSKSVPVRQRLSFSGSHTASAWNGASHELQEAGRLITHTPVDGARTPSKDAFLQPSGGRSPPPTSALGDRSPANLEGANLPVLEGDERVQLQQTLANVARHWLPALVEGSSSGSRPVLPRRHIEQREQLSSPRIETRRRREISPTSPRPVRASPRWSPEPERGTQVGAKQAQDSVARRTSLLPPPRPQAPSPTLPHRPGPRRRPAHRCHGRDIADGRRAPEPQHEDLEDEATRAALCGWAVCLASSRRLSRRRPVKRQVRLLGSVFQGQPPVLLFGDNRASSSRELCSTDLTEMGLEEVPKMYYFHAVREVHEYDCVIRAAETGGLYRTTAKNGKFALHWGQHPSIDLLRSFTPFQKANHFPGSWNIGRKDLLWRNVSRMKRQHPQHFDIMPMGFVLPDDYQAWCSAREQDPSALWIWKPPNAACGKGIRLLSSNVKPSVEKALQQRAGVIQRYVDKPMLLNGFKFDLRIYVVVTSYDPLKVYLNTEGLVRLATEQFSLSVGTLGHRTMHLTNYSVNKHAVGYVQPPDQEDGEEALPPSSDDFEGDVVERQSCAEGVEAPESGGDEDGGVGEDVMEDGELLDTQAPSAPAPPGGGASSKWSFEQLREYMASEGQDYDELMSRIKDLVVKTFLSVEPQIANSWHQGANFSSGVSQEVSVGPNQTCFEIYGFDVIVDDALKPWLLEVNIYPSLSSSSPYDKRVKSNLIAETFTLAGFAPFDHDLVDRALREERENRLMGNARSLNGRSHTLSSMAAVQSAKDLGGEAEWRLILETHDEYMRRGHLERIYPATETVATYLPFFTTQRYSNMVLAKWLELGGARCFLPQNRSELPPWVPRQTRFDPV